MKVRVVITPPKGNSVEKIGDLARDGDLTSLVTSAMKAYRKLHHDLPLFDFSEIKIERVHR